jgi:hypothetical protein
VQAGEEGNEDKGEAGEAFGVELGDALEVAEDQPETATEERKGKDICTPAKSPAEEGEPAFGEDAVAGGDQGEEGEKAQEGEDNAEDV